MRSWAYNCCGVLMGTSWRASCPRWLSLRGDSLPMITLLPSQGDFCATAFCGIAQELKEGKDVRPAPTPAPPDPQQIQQGLEQLGHAKRLQAEVQWLREGQRVKPGVRQL